MPALGGGERVVCFQGEGAELEEIVEIDEPAPTLLLLVALVQRGHDRERQRRLAPGCDGLGLVVGGADESGFGPLDLGGHVGGLDARAAVPGEQRRQQAHLAVEECRRPLAAVGPPPPQLGVGDGVEGAGGHAVAHTERREAGRQLPAALRVNVSASTCRGSAVPWSTRQAMRRVSTRVFPEPAPARMQSGLASEVTACCCAGFNPCSSPSAHMCSNGSDGV